MKHFALLAILTSLLICCSPEDNDEGKNDIKNLLESKVKERLLKNLKSPAIYKPGQFRIISIIGDKMYPGIVNNLDAHAVVKGYLVDHIYLSKTRSTEYQEMVRVSFDDKLNLKRIDKFSRTDESSFIATLMQDGFIVDPITLILE